VAGASRAADAEPPDPEVAASDETTPETPPASHVERVRVTATRLPDPAAETDHLPANVTVIDREAIARSGVRTLQDLLAFEAGAIVYDQVGNDVEKTFDLRGFSSGSGTKVYLDGAPLNDSRNNTLFLDRVPLAALDRVEILRGSAAALAGGGAEAGVIHLRTRQGERLGGSIGVAAGSFDTARLDGNVQGRSGRFRFFVAGMREQTDGFRENAGGDRGQLSATAGVDLGGDRRIELSLGRSKTDLGSPGAVTAAEDPATAPFNYLDRVDATLDQASLNFLGSLAGPFTIAANLFRRQRASESLTTGRSATLFGGFFSDLDAVESGATAQVTHNLRSGSLGNHLTAGLELLDGATDAAGYITPEDDLDQVDRSAPVSLNTADRRTVSLFVQEVFQPVPRLRLTAGARFDRDTVGYEDRLSGADDRTRRFEQTSLRAGLSYDATSRYALYTSYGEGFLPPTPEQLFAFPGFGSNPDLEPQDSATYEVGVTARYAREIELRVALLRVDTENEIVFDPDTFTNLNAGEIRRDGVEASLRGRPLERLTLFANLTRIDAEFRAGADRGNEVPLVPALRFAGGVDLELSRGFAVRCDLLHVGEQVLDADAGNQSPKLDAYTVVNARLTWQVPGTSGVARAAARGLSLFAEARNVLDERYATRGIRSLGVDYFTPAPGRRYLLGARWDL